MANSALAPHFFTRYRRGGASWRGRLEGEFADGGVFVAVDIGYLVDARGRNGALESAGFDAVLLGR